MITPAEALTYDPSSSMHHAPVAEIWQKSINAAIDMETDRCARAHRTI